MPNSVSGTGITTATQSELLANGTAALQSIYGSDINLASDTPDGQWLNENIQAQLDVQDLTTEVYNTFSVLNCIGTVLDQRVAINGIVRQAGTYTVTPITVVTSAAVNLYGQDQTVQQVYTVSDSAGNSWQLETTQLGVSIGSNVFNFVSVVPGAVLTIPNTITVQVTVVLGVTSVNNPTTYSTLGINEESDAALKLRQQKSVSLPSQGYLASLTANLLNIPGVSFAYVYENTTSSTNGLGVPGHSIWVITAGSGAASAIANAIYVVRNAGCGMKGSITYNVTQQNGSIFTVYWDDVVEINLFIAFTATSINGTTAPNIAAIRTTLPTTFVPNVYGEVNINGMATDVQAIDPNTLVTNAGFSTGQVQILTLSGVAASGTFEINYNGNASAAINWNDSVSTIQTKARAVTGLSAVVVTGSIASQTLTFTLTGNVAALIYVVSNSLMTSGPAAITFAYNEGYTNTLTPSSPQYQFLTQSANIIILAMILGPSGQQVAPTSGTVTFVALGGYGSYVYSISINNSGGSINSTSGVYTAGATGPVIDTIQAVDVFGNTATVTVQVT